MLSKAEKLIIALSDFYEGALNRTLLNEYYAIKKVDYKTKSDRKKFYDDLYNLRRRGLINNNGFTPKGLIKLLRAKSRAKKPLRIWDGKWRTVIFDIPEKRRKSRDYLRIVLKDLNFIKLQNSVWVSPYDDLADLRVVISNLGLNKNVILILSINIENEDYLISKFFKNYNVKLVKRYKKGK